MPRAHPSETVPAIPAPRTPICPRCGFPMRLRVVTPDPNYVNLDLWSYSCACGASVDNFIAHAPA